MASGGYRRPASPAAVSGPAGLSRRTDGGPGQPIRPVAGGSYGDRKESVEMQQAAPMAVAGSGAPPAGGGGPAGPPAGGDPNGVFGPTGRPDEPMTAGVPMGPGRAGPGQPLDDNPDLILQAWATATGHPDLIELVNRRRR